MAQPSCPHVKAITSMRMAQVRECEDCVKTGGRWVHLRTCQECGGTRCCDQSPNQHARKHAEATAHHVINSAEPGERWLYCFRDDVFLDY
jgi:ubiquitin-hydrolase Zn-finger-containing protein